MCYCSIAIKVGCLSVKLESGDVEQINNKINGKDIFICQYFFLSFSWIVIRTSTK